MHYIRRRITQVFDIFTSSFVRKVIFAKKQKIESELVGLTILLMIVKYAAFFEFRRLAAPIIPVAF